MSDNPLERELKLTVDGDFALPDLTGFGFVRDRGILRLHATYWDTADLWLAHHGFALRHRNDEDWTLKSPSNAVSANADITIRTEKHFPGPPTTPAPAVLERLEALAPELTVVHTLLRPVVTLDNARHTFLLGAPEPWAELVHDHVRVSNDGTDYGGFTEVEVEVPDEGDPRLPPLVDALRDAGARDAEIGSKYLHGLTLLDRWP